MSNSCLSCLHQSNSSCVSIWRIEILNYYSQCQGLQIRSSNTGSFQGTNTFVMFHCYDGHTVWRKEWKTSPCIQCIQAFQVPNIVRSMQELLPPSLLKEYAIFILSKVGAPRAGKDQLQSQCAPIIGSSINQLEAAWK